MPAASAVLVRPLWMGLLLTSTIVARPADARADEFTFHREEVMGTSLELVVRARSIEAAERAEARVLATIEHLSRVMSGYDPSSEFRRWHDRPGAGPLVVSNELFEVLQASERWQGATRGAFDPRAAIFGRIWSAAAARGQAPDEAELASARAAAARPAWRLDPARRTAERLSDAPLTLDGIAKGYIVERAARAALDPADGVTGALLNVGGDLRLVGDLVRDVGLAPGRGDSESTPPVAFLRVADRAVATSGDAQRGHRVAGRWVSHIVDPATGRPAAGVRSATVVGPRSEDADALATALNVMEPGAGLALVASLDGFEARIETADGRVVESGGWGALLAARPVPMALASAARPSPAPAAPHWADDAEVVIEFELNRPTDLPRGYRRPYVAVWVENAEGLSVRTVAMWVSQTGAGPFQWLPDLKRWLASDRTRKKVNNTRKEVLFTVARPTRPPGKYTVVWDGKDDDGRPLPAGDYTLCVDAAREHGTYQHVETKVTVGGDTFRRSLPDASGVEIRSAAVAYRRKEKGATR